MSKETNDLLEHLNDEQKRAVSSPTDQSTLVLSGAGASFSARSSKMNISFRLRHSKEVEKRAFSPVASPIC